MQIAEGGGRSDYQEVMRALGALADERGMRELALLELADGFLLQGLAPRTDESRWSESAGQVVRLSVQLGEPELEMLVTEVAARRDSGRPPPEQVPSVFYEPALRIIGRYADEQKARGLLLLEQDHAFVVRLLVAARLGPRHELAEFTRDEMAALIAGASELRGKASFESSILDPIR